MKNSRRIHISVTLFLIIILIGLLAVLFKEQIESIYENYLEGKAIQTRVSDWPQYTYQNIWRMRYPAGWEVRPDQNGGGVVFISHGFEQDDANSAPYGIGGKVSYAVFGEYEVFDKDIKVGDQFLVGDRTMLQKVYSAEKLTLAGYPAVYYTYSSVNNVNFLKRTVAVFKNEKAFRFTALFANSKDYKIFEDMFQTLEFIQ